VIEAILSPICRGNRLTDRILLSARNITERKLAEEALRQQTLELQARNEDLNAFAHTVAHDLKDPLVYVVGLAEILRETHSTLLPEKRHAHLQTIAEHGYRMSNIIDELLLLASIRKQHIDPKPIDMAYIVGQVKQRLVYMIEQSATELIVPSTWPKALGYSAWVEEVWTNYISNAIKYGGKPPRIELGADQPRQGTIRFWVRDNGPGLHSEERARLFTPFSQLERVRATGHGLGLSIVRRIMKKLGGEVGVESEIGVGSQFWFSLPENQPELGSPQA
jgi:signal transduction histidine kinase